ncbi:MAG: uncharacterized protein HW416_2619 [Chloroflexi bacterium]|nr:uncharacterized protein [Chloroflexota bacterium]
MTYQPEPIDASHIQLSADLSDLMERLARDVHERWALERIAQGWTWGPRRDDNAKTHPDLVPYEELPELEKDFDRHTATEAISFLLAAGYRIEPPSTDESGHADAGTGEGLVDPSGEPPEEQRLESLDVATLLSMWRAQDLLPGSASPDLCRLLAQRLRATGEPLLAYDVIREGLEHWPQDLRLRQLMGLALADSGATERANEMFAQLAAEGNDDEETLGMLARTHKDLWGRACDEDEKRMRLDLARECYEKAYRRTGGYWTGINAATLAALQGDPAAAALAKEVYPPCLADLRRAEAEGSDRYWSLATLGEAALLMGNTAEAEEWYARAADVGRGRARDLSSTRRNARLLIALPTVQPDVRQRIEACFRVPPVVMFAGHMIDGPDRAQPRFPASIEPAIAAAIRRQIEPLGAAIGFSSAACGSDLLFLEAVLDLGGEVNVILPYDLDQFEIDSVSGMPSGNWQARFRRVLGKAARVVVASDRCKTPSPSIYSYGNLLIRGLAAVRATQLDTELRAMAVWDRGPADGPGGTAALVHEWQDSQVSLDIIDPREMMGDGGLARGLEEPTEPVRRTGSATSDGSESSDIKAMLFADAVGFSRLSEEQVPIFVDRFLGAVGALQARVEEGPIMQNTWGDGLFFVFDGPLAAGRFALDLCDAVTSPDWGTFGLPPDLNLRIGLHAGPVHPQMDPVTRLANYFGVHVSRAARIEPITPPGQVYASEAFAAMCAAHRVDELIADYVGQTPLAKGYGTFRTYDVRRRPC